ncbi:MAG: mechanosensitive ion channel family protein [Pseudomonadales bacterium]
MDQLDPQQIQQYVDQAITMVMLWAPRVVLALVVLIVGWWLIARVIRVMEQALNRSSADQTLTNFLKSLANIALKAMLLVSVASMVGIATTSFLALLGAAGLAIGLALQGSLSNFAGGVLILLFRPFKLGDFIEAQGVSGTVKEMQILNTVLNTPDNKRVIVPNGPLANNNITNFSTESTRRLDFVFGIGYDDDLRQAKDLLIELFDHDRRVLREPAPLVVVSELGDSSVNFTVRVWVQASDLWALKFDMLERVKLAFDEASISIPYPQTDVHLHTTQS